MAQRPLLDRYRDRLHGVLSCCDRIVVAGTLPQVCYAQGMTAFLYARGIRIFDYPHFVEPLRDAIRVRAQELAASRIAGRFFLTARTLGSVSDREVRCWMFSCDAGVSDPRPRAPQRSATASAICPPRCRWRRG